MSPPPPGPVLDTWAADGPGPAAVVEKERAASDPVDLKMKAAFWDDGNASDGERVSDDESEIEYATALEPGGGVEAGDAAPCEEAPRWHGSRSLPAATPVVIGSPTVPETPAALEVGASIEGRWKRGPLWYRGRIAAAASGKRFTVHYEDGSVEAGVRPEDLRAFDAAGGSPRRPRAEVRADIVAFYGTHNRAKVAEVDALLDRCGAGNEEALLDAIRRKYAAAPVPEAAGLSPARLKAIRLEIDTLYARENPAKLETVDGLLRKCVGSEEALLAAIKRKYARDPASDDDDGDDGGVRDRGRVARDLAASERRFERALEVTEACYAAPLRRHFAETGARPAGTAKTLLELFAAADAIRGFARMLRADLDLAIKEAAAPGDAEIGAVFAKYGPFLKMFTAYARRFVESYDARSALGRACADAAASPLAAADEEAALLACVAVNARCRGVVEDVAGYLAAPVSRVTSYERLLRELLDLTPLGHADRAGCERADAAVRAAIDHVDATLQSDVAFRRLLEIHDRCDGKSRRGVATLLDAPTRTLVREGSLEELLPPTKAGGAPRYRPLAAFALTDRLLLATTLEPGRATWKRRLVHHVPVDALDAVVALDGALFSVAAFAGEVRIVLRADSPDQRDRWVKLLGELRKAHRAAPKARRSEGTPPGGRRFASAKARSKKQRSQSWAPTAGRSSFKSDDGLLARLSSLRLSSSAARRS